jgi:hypothetical protein
MKKQITRITFFLMMLLSFTTHAQEIHCNMYKLPFEQMVEDANRIAHAEVLSAQSFWNEKQSMIYTHYTLRVEQSLKGNLSDIITLVVEGGRAQGIMVDYQDRIDLLPGASIVVMLERVPKHWDCGILPNNAFAAYASKQGVFLVNPSTLECQDPFNRFDNLEKLFDAVKARTGKPMIKPQVKNLPNASGVALAAVSTFSPTTITAGTGSVLTITGSGFGATRGAGFVEFTIVDGTYAQPLAKDYITWTDTQIQLYVPSLTVLNGAVKETAATGPIRVTPAGGTAATSPTSLNIKYSLFNRYNTPQDSSVTLRMSNVDGQGGYTFLYNDQFGTIGAGVQAALERAMSTWKCATLVNYKISSSTTPIRTVGYDNVNVLTDDAQTPLPAGVLGRGTNISGLCVIGSIVKAVMIDLDIIVDVAPPGGWNLSANAPLSTQIDFETVLLHEIGHIHSLAHTRNGANNVMAATVSYGAMSRSLQAYDIEAGLDAITRAQVSTGCNVTAHIPATPTLSISSNITFPACNVNSVTFTASVTNMTANTTLNWFRNNVIVAQGTTYTLNNPVNGDIIFCQYNACTTIRSNSITAAITNNTASIAYAASYCKSVTTAQAVTRTGATGGTYSASPAGLSINTSTGAITPSASNVGTFTVTYTVPASGPCAAFSTTASVTIGAAPTISFVYGNASLTQYYCTSQTGSISPTTTASGPVTYSSSPAGLTLNTTTGAFTPSTSAPGIYNVTASVSGTGACAGTVATVVRSIIISAPLATPGAISGSTTGVCGSTKTYSIASVSGASSYTWTLPAGATISGSTTGSSISVVFSSSFTSGTISVRANAINGCNSALRTLTVNGVPAQPGSLANTAPMLGVTTVNIIPVIGATSYLWTVSGASIISGQGTTAITILGGMFSSANVCVRAVNACGQSAQRCRLVNTLQNSTAQQGGMEEEEALTDEKFVAPTIYPNPAENVLNVSFEDSEVQGDVSVEILDAGGLLIQRTYYNEVHGTRLQLSLQDLPVGMYMLRMQSEKGTVHTQRFIKQ